MAETVSFSTRESGASARRAEGTNFNANGGHATMVTPRITATTLAAVLLLAVSVASASANKLSISGQSFRMAWTSMQISGEELEEERTTCGVTLEGSFHSRTVAKVAGALIGYITRATAGNCTVGEATMLTETLPWHVMYESFTGTLPAITSARFGITGLTMLIVGGPLRRCLYRFPPAAPGGVIANLTGGAVTSIRIDEARRHELFESRLTIRMCRPRLGAQGSGTMTTPGTTTKLTITLI
jgi:hypothetical protein